MSMRIGELARRAGVGVGTLRAWERRFALLAPGRSEGRQRLYSEDDLERVCSVRRLVAEGLTLGAAASRVSVAGTAVLPSDDSEALLLRQVIQAADDGIWVSREGVTLFVNRRMAELLRCSIDEARDRPVLDFLQPGDLRLIRRWAETGRAGRRQREEITLRRADGSTFLAEVTTSPMFDQAGRYQGAVAVVRDVTGRREEERQARFRAALLDGVGQAVAAASSDGTIVYINPAAERLFGWPASQMLGKNGLALLAAPAAADEAWQIHSKLLRGQHHTGKMRLTRRDGSEFVAHMTSAPVLGDGGQIIGLIAVFTDLTESIDFHNELRTQELELETIALLGAHALRRPDGTASDLDLILAEALDSIRRVVGADRALLFEVASGAGRLRMRSSSPPQAELPTVPAGGRSLAGYAAMVRRTVLVEDSGSEVRFDRGSVQEPSGAGAAVATPVFGTQGVRAVVIAEWSMPRSFQQSLVHFLESMANVISVALHPSPRLRGR